MAEVVAVARPVLERVWVAAGEQLEPVLPPEDVRRREDERAAGLQDAPDLAQEALGVDDVLEDLARQHDVGLLVPVGKPRHQPVLVEDVHEVPVGLEPALAGALDLRRVDLDPAEAHPLVAPEALQQQPAREAEVEDARAREVAVPLAEQPVHLRVAVLDVEEEPPPVPPRGVVRQLEELAHSRTA